MTAPAHPAYLYSEEVLAFSFAGRPAQPPPEPPAPQAEKNLARCLAAFERGKRRDLVLLGLGSGALARALAERLPPQARLFVCETSPAAAQALRSAGRLDWRGPHGRAQLIADTSPWAHLVLLAQLGADRERACVLPNPEVPPSGRKRTKALGRLLSRAGPATVAVRPGLAAPSLSVAAILKPGEPDLDAFLAQVPAWVRELVLVWDAKAPPAPAPRVPVRLVELAHPLERDFAAQRNRMLAACSGDFLLYLDADERLPAGLWDALPALLADKAAAAWMFPRRTFFPDAAHCRVGLGLWPDPQLRLFRRRPQLAFERPVHERLAGLRGPVGLLLDAGIEHTTHLCKSPREIAAKLELFDAAAGGAIRHTLNPDLPRLPCTVLDALTGPGQDLRCLVLPEYPG
jgi:glycosyltransferase involved in cell wall biosynthesis